MPQITFDITDAQQKQLDDLNAATNLRLSAGAEPSSRQSFAAAAFSKALEAGLAAEAAKAKAKAPAADKPKD